MDKQLSAKKFWFKPKKFWGWFAAYYPVTKEGWIITLMALLSLALIFFRADSASHSVSDTFFGAAPGIVIVFLIFDLISFRTGEYPSWWKRKNEKQS